MALIRSSLPCLTLSKCARFVFRLAPPWVPCSVLFLSGTHQRLPGEAHGCRGQPESQDRTEEERSARHQARQQAQGNEGQEEGEGGRHRRHRSKSQGQRGRCVIQYPTSVSSPLSSAAPILRVRASRSPLRFVWCPLFSSMALSCKDVEETAVSGNVIHTFRSSHTNNSISSLDRRPSHLNYCSTRYIKSGHG